MQPVSLIIVSYNKRPYTELCLRGQLACTPRPAEIIVIDNGSTDGSVEWLQSEMAVAAREAGVEYRLIVNDNNAGACTARNQGLAACQGELIGFLDNDLAVGHRDWLAGLAGTLEAFPETGIVGPKLLYPFAPYDIECAGVALSPNGRVQYRGRGARREAPEFNQPREVQCLISACWLMRRAVVEAIGMLDEVFNPAQFEDFDYCYRARQAGFAVRYEPGVEMYHFENVTTAGSVDVRFKTVTLRNWAKFRDRWQAVYRTEGGPPDEECQWRNLETRPLEQTGAPPMLTSGRETVGEAKED